MKHSPSIPISLLAAAVSCAAKAPSPQAPPPSSRQSPAYHSSVVQPDDEDIRQCDEDVDRFLQAARGDPEFRCDRERIQFAIGQVLLRCGEMFTPMRAEMIRKAVDRNFGPIGDCTRMKSECESAISAASHAIKELARTCLKDTLVGIRQQDLPEIDRWCTTQTSGYAFELQRGAIYRQLQLAILQCSVDTIVNKLGIEPRNESLRQK